MLQHSAVPSPGFQPGKRVAFPGRLSAMPNLLAYQARVAARPKVQEALKAEGLLQ